MSLYVQVDVMQTTTFPSQTPSDHPHPNFIILAQTSSSVNVLGTAASYIRNTASYTVSLMQKSSSMIADGMNSVSRNVSLCITNISSATLFKIVGITTCVLLIVSLETLLITGSYYCINKPESFRGMCTAQERVQSPIYGAVIFTAAAVIYPLSIIHELFKKK